MKVYVLNYDLNKISSVIPELLKLSMTFLEGIEIYSTEGIFYIDNNSTYKLVYNHESIIKLQNYYEQFDLAIDKSVITRDIICQIPPKHLANPIKTIIFKKDPQSKIKFVIVWGRGLPDMMIQPFLMFIAPAWKFSSRVISARCCQRVNVGFQLVGINGK